MRRVTVAAIFLGISMTIYQISSISCVPPKTPKLAVSPLELNLSIQKQFNAQEFRTSLPSENLCITNAGDGEFTWQAKCDADWLHVYPNNGKCTTENCSIKAFTDFDTTIEMSEGNYTTACKFYDINNPANFQSVAVNLVITPPMMKTYVDPLKRFSFKYPQDWKLKTFEKFKDTEGNYFEIGSINPTELYPNITCKIAETTNYSEPNAKGFVQGWLQALRAGCYDVTLFEYDENTDGWDERGLYYYLLKDEKGAIFYLVSTAYVKILPQYIYFIEVSTRGPYSERPDARWLNMASGIFRQLKPIIASFVFN